MEDETDVVTDIHARVNSLYEPTSTSQPSTAQHARPSPAAKIPSPAGYYAVFDGHSGTSCARYLAAHLFDNIATQPSFPDDVPSSLVSAFVEIDHQFHEACKGEQLEHSGSTALVAFIAGTSKTSLYSRFLCPNLNFCPQTFSPETFSLQKSS